MAIIWNSNGVMSEANDSNAVDLSYKHPGQWI